MKTYKFIKRLFLAAMVLVLGQSCIDINQEPRSSLPPEAYFKTESQLEYYTNNLYTQMLPSHGNWSAGTFGSDNQTDNQVDKGYNIAYIPGEWKVGQSGGSWNFGFLYTCNYFLDNALPKYERGEILGSKAKIDHSFGEVYFFRALFYFGKAQTLGDYPIVTTTLPNDMGELVNKSERKPRTEVIRQALSDLDKAIELLMDKPDDKRVKISKNVAYLIKSRVALFEGTWLKYFRDTPFVPNGPGWPGAEKEYNKNYQYPSGSIDAEIDFLLTTAMEAADKIASLNLLVENNNILQQSEADPENPYLNMFSDVDMSKYSEVLLWREYSRGLGIVHNVPIGAQLGNYFSGLTRGFVDNFLMEDGLPIYASSDYAGDDQISDVRKKRDGRLWLFLKEPYQKNLIKNLDQANRGNEIEKYPDITSGDRESGYSTGYTFRKGGVFDGALVSENGTCYTGSITYRAVEAHLNYIEACYELNGNLDTKAQQYWREIRNRAHVDNDFQKTINATDMSQEAKNDWGAYSAGQLVDPTLYNIRRERRCELMAEGFRWADLKRWRALDQLIETPYNIEGFKLWGPMQDEYKNSEGKSLLKYEVEDANVSSPSLSQYLRPQEVNEKSLILKQGGVKWAMAHYLEPISIGHFLITGNTEDTDKIDISTSPIYQNPYWPTVASEGPLK